MKYQIAKRNYIYTDVHPIYDDMLCGPNIERDRAKLNNVLSQRPASKNIDKVLSLSYDTRSMKVVETGPTTSKRPKTTPVITKQCSVNLGASKATNNTPKGGMAKKWSGNCHVFRVDTENGKNWKPLGDGNGGLNVHVQDNIIRTYEENKNIEEIKLNGESIIACTSAKFVQLNASESGSVFGFGFRKEDDRKTFQNLIQGIIDDKKRDRKSAKTQEARLQNENDRQRQKMVIKDDEINDLRQKCLKLELEVKEKNQREAEHERERDKLMARTQKLESELTKMRFLLKEAEKEMKKRDRRQSMAGSFTAVLPILLEAKSKMDEAVKEIELECNKSTKQEPIDTADDSDPPPPVTSEQARL
jgi:hypothetical protein